MGSRKHSIGPNEALIFEVELLSITVKEEPEPASDANASDANSSMGGSDRGPGDRGQRHSGIGQGSQRFRISHSVRTRRAGLS